MDLKNVLLLGNRVDQPLPADVPAGTLFCVQDEGHIIERNNDTATAWEGYSPGATTGITQLTGDATAGPGTGSQALTLANTAITPGTYGDPTHYPIITFDSKGRATSASNQAANSGTVTTTGSPTTGVLAKFSGATSITDVDAAAISAALDLL